MGSPASDPGGAPLVAAATTTNADARCAGVAFSAANASTHSDVQSRGDAYAPTNRAAVTTRSAVSRSSSDTAATHVEMIEARRGVAASLAKANVVPRRRAPALRCDAVHSRVSESAAGRMVSTSARTNRRAAGWGAPVNGGGRSTRSARVEAVEAVKEAPSAVSATAPNAASLARPTRSTSAKAARPFASVSSATPVRSMGRNTGAWRSAHPSGGGGTGAIVVAGFSSSSAERFGVPSAVSQSASAAWNAARTAGVRSAHSGRTPGASVSAATRGVAAGKSADAAESAASRTCECLC